MKRKLAAVLAVLTVLLCLPAQAGQSEPGSTYTRVLGSSGEITVGVRTTYGPLVSDAQSRWYDNKYELVYTRDGVSWSVSGPAESAYWRGWYDGTRFLICGYGDLAPAYRSADGIHWTEVPGEEQDQYPAMRQGQTALEGYRFLLDGDSHVWVMNEAGAAAELSAFTAFLDQGTYLFADVQAYPVPGGIRVVGYSRFNYEAGFAQTYTRAALDALLAAAAPGAWRPDFLTEAGDGHITLGQARFGTDGRDNLYSTDALTWQRAQAMPEGELLPYNGRSFVVVCGDPAGVYASEDGLTWRSLEGTAFQPERGSVYAEYGFLWTGSDYISRRLVMEPYGPHGVHGDWVSPWNTKVCFADGDFNVTGSHDFGGNVTAVGCAGGTCYAQVGEKGTIFASTDQTHWTPTALTALPEALRVTLDGEELAFVPPYRVSGCTMAPLRDLAGAAGLDFAYDAATGTAVCTGAGLTLSVTLGSSAATVNGETRTWLAVPAELNQGRFCVPVRFFAEAAGLYVAWDEAGKTLALSTHGA